MSAGSGRSGATPPDVTRVRPYGDTLDDGVVQLSFSLPVPFGDEGKEAARQLIQSMGMTDPLIYTARDLGAGYSFYIAYARCMAAVDYTAIRVPKLEAVTMSKPEVEDYVRRHIGRRVVVLGATTGTDAHTVGIDAIMNLKGYAGEKGLEAYAGFEAVNLGSQIANEDLVAKAVEHKADALLVSQVVTQKDSHRITLGKLIDMLEAEGIRDRMIVVCGGPRIGHELALELGYDAGFGPGTLAPEVASFIVQQIVDRGLV